MIGRHLHAAVTFIASMMYTAAPAIAQTGDAKVTVLVPDGELKAATDAKHQGWEYTLTLSANVALAANSDVVGQPEGTSYQMGFGINGTLDYLNGPHEWKNVLTVLETFSKTPSLDQVLKSNDLLHLDSIYNYYFLTWLGVFGRGSFEAPMLKTEDIHANDVSYVVTDLAKVEAAPLTGKAHTLADPLHPLTLTESLGIIAKPLGIDPATITIRLGGGGRETLSKGVLLNTSDDKTPPGTITLQESDDVIQAGLEAAVGIAGKFPAQRLTYGLDFGYLLPLINNDALNRSATYLARVGLIGGATFNMFDWLGVIYQFRVQRDFQLADHKIQTQNNLFLTFKYDLIPPKKEEKVDPLEEAKAAAAAADERAKAAEDRAKAAEDRIKALESKPAEPTPPPPAEPTTP